MMKSSFKKAIKSTIPPGSSDPSLEGTHSRIAGVKPWVNGLGLVSTGNRQLDDLLGGGAGLGSSMLIETEAFSNYGITLLAYNLAESLCIGHDTLLISLHEESEEQITTLLPYNLQLGSISQPSLSKDDHTNLGEETPPNAEELKIAWQYKKYINNNTGINPLCELFALL
jgi:hypothetical protein